MKTSSSFSGWLSLTPFYFTCTFLL